MQVSTDQRSSPRRGEPQHAVAPARLGRRVERILFFTFLGIVALIYFVPFYWVITASIKPSNELMRIPPTWWPHGFTLEHHLGVWGPKFARYFLNSFIYAGGTTLISLVTSSLVAFALVKHPSVLGDLLFGVIIATMMVPFATYVVPLHGLLITIERTFGIPMLNTYWGMILPWLLYPFGVFLMRQAMFSVPDDLIDAAKIDGAPTLTVYWQIVVPLLRSNLIALALLTFIAKYNDLLWPLVVATTSRMYPVTLGLVEYIGMYFVEYGRFTAASVAVIAPILFLFLFLQRHILEGVALTGMKG